MKIDAEGKQITLTSENAQEQVALTQVFMASLNPIKRVYKRRGHNNFKGKHRKPCSVCGKKYKNVKLHEFKKHNISPVSLSVTHD